MADSKLQQESIEAHNKKRALHGVPPLRAASDLAAKAQAWADYLVQSGQLAHSQDRGNVGENIAMMWNTDPNSVFTGSDALDQWYGEIQKYTYGTEDMNCGHFSQVVWKGSAEAGFGRAKSSDGKIYIVGQYRPAGNVMGQWRENVLPPQKENSSPKANYNQTAPAPAARQPAQHHDDHEEKRNKSSMCCFK